ncbi:VWA-like domain-containing protein [Pseudoflavonifractor phocaeensis]|uniref:vWA domain-containing protein n=1 Tax=Pseudoflavonifractor phocaeensis TaxID=1870988 RepID=UPI001FAF8AAD|nr:VWA-like domain-containing protein [Pseudoflavonifractor phocaeensis]
MLKDEERQGRQDGLAREVLLLSRNTLLVHLRFLDAALSQLTLAPADVPLATDGAHIYYNARHVLHIYRTERERPVRDYLHMVLHCVFRHQFVRNLTDEALWDLACDIAVESVITDLGIAAAASARQKAQSALLQHLRGVVKPLTAEKIYRYYLDHRPSPEELLRLRQTVLADDHTLWYHSAEVRLSILWHGNAAAGTAEETGNAAPSRSDLSQRWKDISERMQMDLETFSRRQQGEDAGHLMQNLQAVNREKYDYAAFLRKFAVMGEAMKVNDDEFDYIFYTYGMKLFGNMPLIEPLEYKEVKRIREFVIAIDTSGSVAGELVQKFIQKTYNILKQEESFFTKINLHIIQCDAEIQEDVKITSQEEFDRYLATMQLRGFGGTDFRPVFAHVEELRKNREFTNLKGLIYFTDGYGTFPAQKPDYHTAFVFIRDEYQNPDVPPWAIKLVLEPEEI